MGFKEDADFARFVSMGAVAADAVRTDLKRYGHDVIELERYAMANKVWQTKVKRLRLPDLVCTRCGVRVESRGKSKLGIVVSHSDTADRAWDAGMRDDDFYAFVRVDMGRTPPYVSAPAYFRTSDMRACRRAARESKPKAVSEGSERTLSWAAWIPPHSGIFVDQDTQGRLVCQWEDGKRYRYAQWLKWSSGYVYLEPGDGIVGNDTMLAGIVAPPGDITCYNAWDLRAALRDRDPGERFSAVKTAGVLCRTDLVDDLLAISRRDGDWRLRLEATASLARFNKVHLRFIIETALAADRSAEERMEAVFILSEIPSDQAVAALSDVASEEGEKSPELRAAAVWGLARGVCPQPSRVLLHAADDDEFVALHAIAGLQSLPESLLPDLLTWFDMGDRRAATAATILRRLEAVRPLLQMVQRGGRARLWALRALGDLTPENVRSKGEGLLTEQIEHDLEHLWIGHSDWLRGEGADGLDALDVQKYRFNPLLLS